MLIFGIDTATKTASTAVVNFDGFENAKVLSEIQACGKISHSENLMPMVDYTLKCAGLDLNDIDLFAVSHGPGSFTGIRIGIATVKGLAFSFGEEKNNCIGISSLYALAYNFYAPDRDDRDGRDDILILPAIDARRKQIYNAVTRIVPDGLEYMKNDRIITVSELETELNSDDVFSGGKIVFTGDGADMCYNEVKFDGKIQVPDILKKPSAASLCRAAYIAVHGGENYKKGGAVSPGILAPSYLIKTQAEREYTEKNG